MKKIKSIKQLKAEKKRLRLRQTELEDKIQNDWAELKETIKPVSVMKEAYNKFMDKEAEANLNGEVNIFKSTLNYGISLMAKKFTEKAGEQLDKLFKKRKDKDE